jgi:rSAM/selenodomain-associated transferase 2
VPQSPESISIIIPVLNEAARIEATIKAIAKATGKLGIEIIVVDGGSRDATVELAKAAGANVRSAVGGRSGQMNEGAKLASGSILVFLHGDTLLPQTFDDLVRSALTDGDFPKERLHQRQVIAGAFALQIDDPLWSLRWIERGVNWRSRVLQMPYGDQAIFLRAATFWQLGGFPAQPIMEDFELIRRLGRLGKIAIVPVPVTTAARRWLQRGIIKTTLINQLVVLGYFLGISPDRLAQLYRQKSF